MADHCTNCDRDPGDGYRCRHCGAMQYRYAIESDDWTESNPELEDEQNWDGGDSPPPDPDTPRPPKEQSEGGGYQYAITSDDWTGAHPELEDEQNWDDRDNLPPAEGAVDEELEALLRPPEFTRRQKAEPQPQPFQSRANREPAAGPIAEQDQGRGCRGCLTVFLVIAIGLAAVGILLGFFFSTDGETGSIEVDADAGECLLLESDGSVVTGTTTVDCTEPHDAEVYLTGTFPESSFPGDSYLAGEADVTCLNAFESYVGTPYADSIYYYDWLVPTEDSWESGDRELLCAIVSGDGSRLVGSAFASGR